jgi:hypothetical protein
VQSLKFAVLKQTARGSLLLECAKGGQPRAVSGENAFFKKQLVGKVFDSIASVDEPFYLMRVAQGVDAKTLLGKTLETKK